MAMEEKESPNSWGNGLEQGTAPSSQSLRAALSHSTSKEAHTVFRSRIPVRVSRMASTRMDRRSQRLTAHRGQEERIDVPAALGEQDPAQPLLHETEPSQEMETRSPADIKKLQESRVVHRSHIPVLVSRVASTGMHRPSQRATPQQNRTHGKPGAASPGKQGSALPLLHQTKPSQEVETRNQLGSCTLQETRVVHRSRIPVHVSRVVSTGMHSPSQQPTAQEDRTHGKPVSASPGKQDSAQPLLCKTEPCQQLKPRSPAGRRTQQKTHEVHRSHIPVLVARVVSAGLQRSQQQLTEEQEKARGRPVSAPLGSLPGTWCHRQVTEQHPAVSCVQRGRKILPGTSLSLPAKPAVDLSTQILSESQKEPPQELDTRREAGAEHTMSLSRLTSPSLQELQEISSSESMLGWLEEIFPNQGGALAKEAQEGQDNIPQELGQGNKINDNKLSQEEDEGHREQSQREDENNEDRSQGEEDNKKTLSQEEDNNDKELSQGEIDISYNFWDIPLSPVSERHAYTAAQEVPSSRFRRALRALSWLCCCPCMGGQPED